MISFIIAADVYLNSKMEYKTMKLDSKSRIDELIWLQMILFSLSIILQLSIVLSFFLIICNTFSFQVGCLFPFKEEIFQWFLVLTLYILLSCNLGGLRLNHNHVFVDGNTDLWRTWYYFTLSALHKLVAYHATMQPFCSCTWTCKVLHERCLGPVATCQ